MTIINLNFDKKLEKRFYNKFQILLINTIEYRLYFLKIYE